MKTKLGEPLELTPYQPSRAPEAAAKIAALKPRLTNMDEAAASWLAALGSAPRCADECITVFSLSKGYCVHCQKVRKVRVVLDGFKGLVDGNMLLCAPCIDELL